MAHMLFSDMRSSVTARTTTTRPRRWSPRPAARERMDARCPNGAALLLLSLSISLLPSSLPPSLLTLLFEASSHGQERDHSGSHHRRQACAAVEVLQCGSRVPSNSGSRGRLMKMAVVPLASGSSSISSPMRTLLVSILAVCLFLMPCCVRSLLQVLKQPTSASTSRTAMSARS